MMSNTKCSVSVRTNTLSHGCLWVSQWSFLLCVVWVDLLFCVSVCLLVTAGGGGSSLSSQVLENTDPPNCSSVPSFVHLADCFSHCNINRKSLWNESQMSDINSMKGPMAAVQIWEQSKWEVHYGMREIPGDSYNNQHVSPVATLL